MISPGVESKEPYFAVIFTSTKSKEDTGYEEMAQKMLALAADQPGFLGVESARGVDGLGITVSYWRSEADIQVWKRNSEHRVAQEKGRSDWYSKFRVRVCRVEREYGK